MTKQEYNERKSIILASPYYEKRGKPKKESWSARYKDLYQGEHITRRFSGGFRTRKECKAAYDVYVQERLAALEEEYTAKANPQNILFRTLTDMYYDYEKSQVKESSFNTIRAKIENRIIPAFGDKHLEEITPAMVLEWQMSLDGYSFEYRQSLMVHLKAILKFGETFYDSPNPSKKVPPLRSKELKREMRFWTPEEFSIFVKCVDKEVYNLFFKTLFIAGCRKGEATALLWSDINFKENTISISKSTTTKGDSSISITSPKTQASVRVITMPEDFMSVLKSYKSREKMSAEHYVFGKTRPLPFSTIDFVFKKAIAESGLKEIRIHDLRHSCASLLISKGFSIVAVSKRLGHSSTKETLDTYAHLFPSEAESLTSAFVGVGAKMGAKT